MRSLILTITLLLLGYCFSASAEAISTPNSVQLFVGKSSLIQLDEAVSRVSVSDPKVADINVISPKEIYIQAKNIGSTNLIVWNKTGKSSVREIQVDIDITPLKNNLTQLMPDEKYLQISSVSGSVIISGSVENIIQADIVRDIAEAFILQINRMSQGSGGQSGTAATGPTTTSTMPTNAGAQSSSSANRYKVINLLKVRDPQQVMLQVKVAEVNKDYLEKIGVKLNGNIGQVNILSNFSLKNLSAGSVGTLSNKSGSNLLDAEKNEELIRVLAEPTIVAMSGQEGSFLVGGRIYLPQYSSQGSPSTIQVDYGVGLKFLPIVLDKGRINLKVAPEVSNISEQSFSFAGANANTTTIVPKVLTKSVSTTVQIREGETLVIGGLLNNEITESVKAFPFLGDVPIIGSLFRSKQFTSKKTELVVIVTPSLVASSDTPPALPNERYPSPNRTEFFLGGKLSNELPDGQSGKSTSPATTEAKP